VFELRSREVQGLSGDISIKKCSVLLNSLSGLFIKLRLSFME